jgi:hypothetical protein
MSLLSDVYKIIDWTYPPHVAKANPKKHRSHDDDVVGVVSSSGP